ncbi:MAG: GNAT family N-acetyltransferase [Pseudomonadota bacterium]
MAIPAILHTDRLSLRVPQIRDAAQITERIGVRDVAWNLGRAPYPYALSDAEDFISVAAQNWADDQAYVFMLEHAKDGVVGCCGLDRHTDEVWEIGYWVGQPWWGQGFVSEASSEVMRWAQEELDINQFVSGHFTDNPASGRILKKLGFEPVDIVPHIGAARGVPSPALRYTKGAPPEMALKTASH